MIITTEGSTWLDASWNAFDNDMALCKELSGAA